MASRLIARSAFRGSKGRLPRGFRGARYSTVAFRPAVGAKKLVVGGAFAASFLYYTVSQVHADEKKKVDLAAVKKDIQDLLDDYDYDDGSFGPILIRLAWHASGTYDKKSNTGGSNGAGMRWAPESAWGANAGLDKARARLEPIKKKYPDLSYSDLWVYAGYVALETMGGPTVPFRLGRVDHVDEKKIPKLADGLLPDATQGAQHLRDIFYRMGFNDQEIVALSGAHGLGRCHLDRSGFEGPWTNAPTTFSNEYFRILFDEKWVKEKNSKGNLQFWDQKTHKLMMLPTDLAVVEDPKFREWSEKYKKDQDLFFKDFAAAFKKLTELGVPGFSGSGKA